MPVLVSASDPRAQQAIDIVVADEWKTFLDYDGRVSWSIPSMTGSHYYRATDNGCTCPDLQYRPWVACKHMLAVRLQLELDKEGEYAF
jgi:predicted nucleic acid-binding Zn finger protein